MSWDFSLDVATDARPEVDWQARDAIDDAARWLRNQGGDGPRFAEAIEALDHLRPVVDTVFYDNYTWNVGPMLYPAFDSQGLAEGIRSLNGMPAADALPVLNGVLDYFAEHQEALEAKNPDNGWGSYDGVVGLLRRMYSASAAHPTGVWSVR